MNLEISQITICRDDMKFDKDKQEAAQWFAAPQTLKNILEAVLARVSSLKGQVLAVQHLTMYDGVFEKARSFKCLCLYSNPFVLNPKY